jgi:serine/threonine protein kinase
VAIRELYLGDLPLVFRRIIQGAAAHESVSAAMPGSSLLEAGDRLRREKGRHYLVMQLHEYRGTQRATPLTMAQLLLQPGWPSWLTIEVTLRWGCQLCRSVARLHRLGVLLGDLSPLTLLVDQEGTAPWAPMQLVSWPPAPQFWQVPEDDLAAEIMYEAFFPLAEPDEEDVFVAPERFKKSYDERSDVYSLGAILYLLFTHYAPASAINRLDAMYNATYTRPPSASRLEPTYGMELTLPRLINPAISPLLEQVLLHALDINPEGRYQTAFKMVEALEALDQMESQHDPLQLYKDERTQKFLRQILR